jgi:secreted trypsin-like serine protease
MPRHQRASNTSAKLRLSIIIYCITIFFQVLSVQALADIPVPADTVDPAHSHISNKTINAQISNGEPATDGEFPYMAGVYLRRRDMIICGGAILSSQWVLTSGWCLKDHGKHDPPNFELQKSINELAVVYGSSEEKKLSQASISKVHIHPQLDLSKPYHCSNDLALLELERAFSSSKEWHPARIVPKEGAINPGDKLILTSWGYVGDRMPSTLQKVRTTVGSHPECQSNVLKWDSQDDSFICTVGESSPYSYDRGSPLAIPTFLGDDEHSVGYIAGITCNWFFGDTSPIIYYVHVAKHVDWIANVMGVNSSDLLAFPEFRLVKSVASFPTKRFDDILLSITLCSLVLTIIIFNN